MATSRGTRRTNRDIHDAATSAYDDHDRKANGLAEVDAHIIGRQLKPLADHEGVSVPDGMAALTRQHVALRYGNPEAKRQTLAQVMDGYGVVPQVGDQMIEARENSERLSAALNDPGDARHDEAVALVQQDWAARQVGGYQQQVGQYEQQIDGFARATDNKGNLAHPHFAEVYEDMVGIAEATTARGKQPDLQTVYRQALLENPRLRQAEQVRRARQGAGMLSGSGGADTGHRGDTSDDLDSIIRSQVG